MTSTRWAELDLRSLAVFRIVLGGLVLLDTVMRGPFLGDFMTDRGVLPRADFVSSRFADFWLSFHLGSGNLLGQVILSLLLAGIAVALMVGWRTPLMTAACWVMLNSLQARNPFIGDRGDLQLELLLFWAIFLPLGARFSLDQRQGRRPFGQAHGLSAAALVLQFAWIYLFAALLKTGDFWLARGDALKFSLLSPMFATDLGRSLLSLGDPALRALNYLVIAGELFVAFLLLSPFLVSLTRRLAVALLVVFHLAVLFMFQLGLFPLIGALTPLVLLPGDLWGEEDEGDAPTLPPVFKVVVGCCALLAFLSNLSFHPGGATLPRPESLRLLTDRLRLEQHWDLFAPLPPINGTFRLVRLTPEGEEVVLFEGPPSEEKPELQSFPGHRWKMLMLATIYPEFALMRERTARVLARRVDRQGGPGKLRYSFVLRPISEKGTFQRPVIQPLWIEP